MANDPSLTFAAIKDVIAASGTWFEVDDDDLPQELRFTSRRHGDIGSETSGRADRNEARRLATLLYRRWPDLNINWYVVDEWVTVACDLEPRRYCADQCAAALAAIAKQVEHTLGGTHEAAATVDGILLWGNRPGGPALARGRSLYRMGEYRWHPVADLQPETLRAALTEMAARA